MKEADHLKKELEKLRKENATLKSQLNIQSSELLFEKAKKGEELTNNIYLKSSNQGIWDIDIEKNIVHVNNKLAEILELPENTVTITYQELDEFVLKEDIEKLKQARQEHIDGRNKFFELDYRIKTRSGNIKWIHSTGKIVSYVKGNIPGRVVGVTTDITVVKSIEERLRLEEEKYKSFFINSPLGTFKSTYEGDLLEANIEFARLFGFSSINNALEAIKNIASKLYVNPEDRNRIVKTIKTKKGVHTYEAEFKRQDGKIFVGRVIAKKVKLIDGEYIEGHIEDISENKRILDILLKSEEKFNQLANTITDVIWIVDSNSKLVFINKAFEQVFGRKIEFLLEHPEDIINWIHPDDRQRLIDIYKKQSFKRNQINEFYRIYKPDQELRWIWGRNYPIFDENGDFSRVVGVMTDVTEQKLLENALMQSNKKISLLLEQTPLAYIEWNRKFEITNWNESATEIFQYTREEAIGQSIIDLIVPSYNKDFFIHLLNDLIDQKGRTRSTNENIDKEGNVLVCEWYNNALVDNDGKIIGLASIVQDITAKVKAEKEVIYSHNFFNTTFNAIPDYIHVVDQDLKIVFVNQSFQEFLKELNLKIAQEGVLLKEIFPFLKAKIFREYRQVFESGEELNTEEFTKVKNRKIYTETRKTPIFEDGVVKYVVTTVRNVTPRVNAEQALRESEKRLQLAFDAANDGLWDFNPKTKEIFYFSPRWFQMLGYEPDEFPQTYETWSQLLHPEERVTVENLVWDFINNKKDAFTVEFRMRNKDGHYQWILSRGDVVEFDETGFPTRMVGTHVDITENKKILNLLSNKEQQLSTLLENSKDSIMVLGVTGDIKFASNLEAKIIGEPITELVGFNYLNYINKKDKTKFLKVFKKSIENPEKRYTIEYCSAFDTGEIIYLEAILSNHFETKGIEGIVFNIRNITDKKLEEFKKEELVQNQKLLSESAQEFLKIRTLDDIYRILSMKLNEIIDNPLVFISSHTNNNVENIYSSGINNVTSKINDLIGEDLIGFKMELNTQRKKLLEEKRLVELKGGISGLTLEHVNKKVSKQLENLLDLNKIYIIGIIRNESLLKSIVILTSGNVEIKYPDIVEALVYQCSVAIDRVLLESELRKSKDQAEKADKLKSAFLANISHEIRTPMNAILGFSELLNDDEISKKERVEFVDIINNQGQQLLRLINDIVDISKIESGQVNIVVKKVNLNVFIESLNQLYLREIRSSKGNKIILSKHLGLKDEEANVFIDENRVFQVLVNLFNNAVKYTEEGKIRFGYTIVENEIKFFVEDTGVGISDEMKEIIFERFRQADSSQVKRFGGVGLGLAISKGIVELMNGRIWVETKKEKGAKFVFTIPYQPNEEKFKLKKINYNFKGKFNWEGYKILVVEDNPASLKFLKTILSETNITIFEAKNGKEAIELFKNNKDIHLALLDVQLPEISGTTVCQEIKKINPKIKIILQTAYAMPGDEKICLKSGADDYLTKPVKANILKPLINYYLETSK